MNNRKIKGLIGLALRARQTAAGMDACRLMIRSGKCGILLIDAAAGINTRKKAAELCMRTGTPLKTIPEGMIEEATGKNNMVMGLLKGNFAQEILVMETDQVKDHDET